jgi:hypothetical protein
MTYNILPRTYKMAHKLGVKIFPSDKKSKKIEVYDSNGQFITYIGAANFSDYPTYLQMEKNEEVPKGYADKRRELYWKRHRKEIEKLGDEWEGSPSYYAFLLLWT